MQKRRSGLTLIELMITVAMIGILAAIAALSYRVFVILVRIPEATTTLGSIRARMEQIYQDNRVHSNAAATGSDPVMWRQRGMPISLLPASSPTAGKAFLLLQPASPAR